MDAVGTVRFRDWNDGTYTIYVKRDENLWTAVYIDGVDGLGHPPFDAVDADAADGKLIFYRGHREKLTGDLAPGIASARAQRAAGLNRRSWQ